MNERRSYEPDDKDNDVENQLQYLRRICAPISTQKRNRISVKAELQARVFRSRRPWWQRSIEVPVPLVFAACLLIAIVSFGWISSVKDTRFARDVDSQTKKIAPHDIAENRSAQLGVERVMSSIETYVCGIGTTNSETLYVFPEQMR